MSEVLESFSSDEEAPSPLPDVSTRLRKLFQMSEHPNQVFAELQELLAGRWVETARYVKYEETVDVDGGRWSTPHVASFEGKSITCLQHMIANGICSFGNSFGTLQQIANMFSYF